MEKENSRATDSTHDVLLADYQQSFVQRVSSVVAAYFFRRQPPLRILDAGCDPSGRQLSYLAQLTSREVVGVNIGDDFPSQDATRLLPPNARMLRMDATRLDFPDDSFDLVLSSNVLEHVSDPRRYLTECRRVMKKRGIGIFETYPLWTGPRGHHVMEVMVNRFCSAKAAATYRNDGSIIPDWGHVVDDEPSLRRILSRKVEGELLEYILYGVFRAPDINRVPWRVIRTSMEELFPEAEIWPSPEPGLDVSVKPAGLDDSYDVAGFGAVVRKTPSLATDRLLRKHIVWRVKKIGQAFSG